LGEVDAPEPQVPEVDLDDLPDAPEPIYNSDDDFEEATAKL
jgi:hypothetical protein